MAVPKKKQSRTRTRRRRATKKIKYSSMSVCPQCGSAKLPHRICGNCGYYGEKQIVNKEQNK